MLSKNIRLRRLEIAAHRRLALCGWIAYILSWVTPGLPEGWIGARAFIAAAQYGARYLFHPDSVSRFMLGVCLLLGWLANFSIFMPLSVRARLGWLLAPWLPFVAALLSAPGSLRGRLFGQLYFYPWALGIACIHIAMIQSQRHRGTRPEGP